jgi:translation initiation factor 2B subunit (eIF-2B alpha/beta/delta family)
LTKKLEETANILSRIKSKLNLKTNDEIVEKIDNVQKKLSKNEKFVSALGKLAKELESSVELKSIFKEDS